MKRVLIALAFAGLTLFGASKFAVAEEVATAQTDSSKADSSATDSAAAPAAEVAQAPAEPEAPAEVPAAPKKTFHEVVKEKFIEGGVPYMVPILLCMIIGLAIAIERIISLNLASTNNKKLLKNVEAAIEKGGVASALEITKSTKGPVASIFTQGLIRVNEGIDQVEKAIVSYGSVEMGKLETGFIWISLFIALAPMLGFFGTVIGMIEAFDAIEAAGDISPSLVAGGIKVALITTVAGLIVAMILQVLYNYLVSKVEAIVNSMEDASIGFVDLLIVNQDKLK